MNSIKSNKQLDKLSERSDVDNGVIGDIHDEIHEDEDDNKFGNIDSSPVSLSHEISNFGYIQYNGVISS